MLCFLAQDIVQTLLFRSSLLLRMLVGLAAIVCNHFIDCGAGRLAVLALRLHQAHAVYSKSNIDHPGHLGGYLTGLFLGFVLLPNHYAGDVLWGLTPWHQLRRDESAKGLARQRRTADTEKLWHEAVWIGAGVVGLATLWGRM